MSLSFSVFFQIVLFKFINPKLDLSDFITFNANIPNHNKPFIFRGVPNFFPLNISYFTSPTKVRYSVEKRMDIISFSTKVTIL